MLSQTSENPTYLLGDNSPIIINNEHGRSPEESEAAAIMVWAPPFTSHWHCSSPLIPFFPLLSPLLPLNAAFHPPPPPWPLPRLSLFLLLRWPTRWSTKWRCSATSGSTTTTGFATILVPIPKFFPTFGMRTPTPISSCPVPFLLSYYTNIWKFKFPCAF